MTMKRRTSRWKEHVTDLAFDLAGSFLMGLVLISLSSREELWSMVLEDLIWFKECCGSGHREWSQSELVAVTAVIVRIKKMNYSYPMVIPS